ncbi:MAG: 23S rRNA (uracil(1939)-C(5))-methyltransferase RlmD, partial [Candidatus Eremiobacteraeota bacterium]|nr:23S rRNA (uracil(1939)-C(5))-methyltransferase RlmD [Candidatus Eremiobacteraeota bacterium]
VLEPSELRREAPCRHFGVCGGCTMQQMAEATALELKVRPHYEMLRTRFPEAVIKPPVSSPTAFSYRTKVELTFLNQRNGESSLGFHRRGRFDRGVDVGRCWLTPLPPSLLDNLREWRDKYDLRGWDPRANDGDLRYLVYRHASRIEQNLAALVVNGETAFDQEVVDELVSRLKQCGVSGAYWVAQSSVAGAVVPDEVRHLYGDRVLQEQLGKLQFELGWNSFFQVNPPAYERLLETMRAWRETPAGGRVLDLFCGVGSIGLSLYQPGDELLGVELVEQAVIDARENARRNEIEARFEHRTAESVLKFETDLLILDPPRSGCHPSLLAMLEKNAPAEEMFYVSCNPHRLAEELDQLQIRYRLVRAQAFDFFPQTHHAELLLHFKRR